MKATHLLSAVHTFLLSKDACSITVLSLSQLNIYTAEASDASSLAIVLGGDGTILRASLCLHALAIPILAIHAGTVGFLAEHGAVSWQEAIDDFLSGKLPFLSAPMLAMEVYQQEKFAQRLLAINEVAITSVGRKLLAMTFKVGSSPTMRVRAEGLVLSTPTGSTGYSLTLGAPIISPSAKVLLLQAIAPFDLSARPIIFDEADVVWVEVASEDGLLLLRDGEGVEIASGAWEFRLGLASERVLWAVGEQREALFYQALQKKLGWFTLYPGASVCCKS
nr:NAD(+)/NADH kinase [Entomospira culicis]